MSDTIWVWQGTNPRGEFRRSEHIAESAMEVKELVEKMGITVLSVFKKGAPADDPANYQATPPNHGPSQEAAERVASTIDAMSRIPEMQTERRQAQEQPTKEPVLVHEFIFDLLPTAKPRIDKLLADGGKVVHMQLISDATGRLTIAAVIEKEKTE